MQALQTIETSSLMDLLSKYTIEFTRLLTDGSSQEEYLKCKEAIKAIQLEIEIRKNKQAFFARGEISIRFVGRPAHHCIN